MPNNSIDSKFMEINRRSKEAVISVLKGIITEA